MWGWLDKKIKLPRNMITFIDKFYYFFAACGIASYKRRQKGAQISYRGRKVGKNNLPWVVAIQIIMWSTQIFRFVLTDRSDSMGFAEAVSQHFGMLITVTLSQIIFLVKNDTFVQIVEIIMKVDRDLLQLRKNVSFKEWYLLLTSGLTFLIIYGPVSLVLSNRTHLFKVLDYFGYSYPIMVRIVLVTIGIVALWLLRTRYIIINKCLTDLDREEINDQFGDKRMYKKRTLNFVVNHLKDIHENVTKACIMVSESFAGVVFLFMIYNYVQSIFAIFYLVKGYRTEVSPFELFAMLITLTLQVLIFTYLAFITEVEASNTFALVGNMSFYVKDQKIMSKINTFLLHGLHFKLKFTCWGLIPIRLSIFIQQVSYVNIFIMLLINYY